MPTDVEALPSSQCIAHERGRSKVEGKLEASTPGGRAIGNAAVPP
jgi:hypothetical protein